MRNRIRTDQRSLRIALLVIGAVLLLLSAAGCRARRQAKSMYAVTDMVIRDTIDISRPVPALQLSVTTPIGDVLTLEPEHDLTLRDTTGPVSGQIRLGWTPEGLLSITAKTDTFWLRDTIYREKALHIVAPCPDPVPHQRPAKPCPDKANNRTFSSFGGIGRSWATLFALFPWTLAIGVGIWLWRRFLGKQ
jgi:hypothetical protein